MAKSKNTILIEIDTDDYCWSNKFSNVDDTMIKKVRDFIEEL